MAAAVQQTPFENYLSVEMKLGIPALGRVMAVVQEGITTFDDLKDMDEGGIKTLVDHLRKPGGMLVNPANGQAVPNPGVQIPTVAVNRLKLAVAAARYYDIVDRPLTPQIMAYDVIQGFSYLKQIEDAHSKPDSIVSPSKNLTL